MQAYNSRLAIPANITILLMIVLRWLKSIKGRVCLSLFVLLFFLFGVLPQATHAADKKLFVNGFVSVPVIGKTRKQRDIALPNARVYMVEFGQITSLVLIGDEIIELIDAFYAANQIEVWINFG